MKEVTKLAFRLEVPSTSFNTWASLTPQYLEMFHENALKNAGLLGYTGEVGDTSQCKKNLVNTEKEFADCYYVAPRSAFMHTTPLKDVLGLDNKNFFKTIFQVCVLLERNYDKILYPYRCMGINEGRTHMFFPFVNYLNQKDVGSISVNNGASTFSSSLNFETSAYKDYSVAEYWGSPENGILLILPQNSVPAFLQNVQVEHAKDYKTLSLEEFKKEIKTISDTTEEGEGFRAGRNNKIQERIHVELSYEKERIWPGNPVPFSHPEGSFVFDFSSGVL